MAAPVPSRPGLRGPRSFPAASRPGAVAAAVPPLLVDLGAYWNLDEIGGDRVDSHAGLTLFDNNTVGSAPGVGPGQTAAKFVKASAEYLSRPHEAALLLTGSWEFGFWTQHVMSAGFASWLSKGVPEWGSGFGSMEFYAHHAIGRPDLGVRLTDDSGFYRHLNVNNVEGLVFRYVTCYHDAAAGVIGSSVDGIADPPSIPGVLGYADTHPLEVGRIRFGGQYLDGLMSALGFWHRVLTPAERLWLRNGGTAARMHADLASFEG